MRVCGRGASGPMGSEHGLSREIRMYPVPRHVRAGTVDKYVNLGFVYRRRLESGCTRLRGLTEEGGKRCGGATTAAQSG